LLSVAAYWRRRICGAADQRRRRRRRLLTAASIRLKPGSGGDDNVRRGTAGRSRSLASASCTCKLTADDSQRSIRQALLPRKLACRGRLLLRPIVPTDADDAADAVGADDAANDEANHEDQPAMAARVFDASLRLEEPFLRQNTGQRRAAPVPSATPQSSLALPSVEKDDDAATANDDGGSPTKKTEQAAAADRSTDSECGGAAAFAASLARSSRTEEFPAEQSLRITTSTTQQSNDRTGVASNPSYRRRRRRRHRRRWRKSSQDGTRCRRDVDQGKAVAKTTTAATTTATKTAVRERRGECRSSIGCRRRAAVLSVARRRLLKSTNSAQWMRPSNSSCSRSVPVSRPSCCFCSRARRRRSSQGRR
jgi:hypothetical protein